MDDTYIWCETFLEDVGSNKSNSCNFRPWKQNSIDLVANENYHILVMKMATLGQF